MRSSPEEDRSGVLRSVVDFQAAINRFLEEDNRRSAPSAWTAGRNKIIAAVRRGRQNVRFVPLGPLAAVAYKNIGSQ